MLLKEHSWSCSSIHCPSWETLITVLFNWNYLVTEWVKKPEWNLSNLLPHPSYLLATVECFSLEQAHPAIHPPTCPALTERQMWVMPSLKSHCCSFTSCSATAFPQRPWCLWWCPNHPVFLSNSNHTSHSLSHCHCPSSPSAEQPQQHFSSLKCTAQMGSTSQTKATAALFTREKDQWASMKGQEADVLTVTCW